jgi:hypothetical protein
LAARLQFTGCARQNGWIGPAQGFKGLSFYGFKTAEPSGFCVACLKIDVMIAAAILIVLGIYLACGLVFAVPFAFWGAQKIDPHAAPGGWGFRLLIIPGTMALWPLLMLRCCRGIHEPLEESNAHRRAARLASEQASAATSDPK